MSWEQSPCAWRFIDTAFIRSSLLFIKVPFLDVICHFSSTEKKGIWRSGVNALFPEVVDSQRSRCYWHVSWCSHCWSWFRTRLNSHPASSAPVVEPVCASNEEHSYPSTFEDYPDLKPFQEIKNHCCPTPRNSSVNNIFASGQLLARANSCLVENSSIRPRAFLCILQCILRCVSLKERSVTCIQSALWKAHKCFDKF